MTTLLLPLTQTAISDSRSHLAQFPGADPVVGSYLTRYANWLMCAEIEKVVSELIRNRLLAGCGDQATASFVRSIRRGAVRNATFAEIREKVSLFGSQYRANFDELISQTVEEGGKEKLGIAVENRNTNAHDHPEDITLRELEDAFSVASKVVEAVRDVLSTLRPNQGLPVTRFVT